MERMTLRTLVVVGCGLMLLGGSALAQETPTPPAKKRTPVIRERQANQRARIHEGVKSGELTRPEAAHLRKEQRKINRDVATAKKDGTVTPAERRKITREQNRASRDIARKKHNNRTRP